MSKYTHEELVEFVKELKLTKEELKKAYTRYYKSNPELFKAVKDVLIERINK